MQIVALCTPSDVLVELVVAKERAAPNVDDAQIAVSDEGLQGAAAHPAEVGLRGGIVEKRSGRWWKIVVFHGCASVAQKGWIPKLLNQSKMVTF